MLFSSSIFHSQMSGESRRESVELARTMVTRQSTINNASSQTLALSLSLDFFILKKKVFSRYIHSVSFFETLNTESRNQELFPHFFTTLSLSSPHFPSPAGIPLSFFMDE